MGRTPRIVVISTVAIAASAALYASWSYLHPPAPPTVVSSSFAARPDPVDRDRTGGRYMFNISLHTAEEISGMLQRAEELAAQAPALRPQTGIALVLHGPEIRLFTKDSYRSNKALIDLARRLDSDGIVEIKMCQTAMRSLGVKEEDVADFVSFVPYAPDEIERLQAEGYVYL